VVNEESVKHLAQSLSVEGLIHPIELDITHTIIVGEMRYRAAKSLNWETIDARINDRPMTPYERLRRQMSENLQQSGAKGGGESMNPIDTSNAWAKLYELKTGHRYQAALHPMKLGLPGPLLEIAKEVGVRKQTVWEYMQIQYEPKTIIEDMLKGRARTDYIEAGYAPKELRGELKKKIARGEFTTKDQIRATVHIAKQIPELAKMQMERNFSKESQGVNRILSSIINLSLGLVSLKLKDINTMEQNMVRTQLEWIQEKITAYLGGE
jgi:hypothetical protein